VAKAYAELEGQGVIETVPGRGCFLKENNSPFRKDIRLKMVAEEIDAAIVQAHHLRVEDKEFLALVKERLEAFEVTNKAHEAKAKEQL
jgi:GntR family transcriptional regulator